MAADDLAAAQRLARRAEAQVVADLVAAGFDVGSISELRESGHRYRAAVPVLMDWLPRLTNANVREEVVRALSVPWAGREASRLLIDEFQRVDQSENPSWRWAAGNALNILADDSDFEDLVGLAVDQRYGRSRQMIVLGLGKSERPEVGDVLVGLLGDPEVNGHAAHALRRVKAPAARPGLELLLTDERAWVRRAAEKALAALG